MLKRIIVFISAVLVANTLVGQSYEIKNETQRINSNKYDGVSSLVNGDFEKVEDFWLDYIKDLGKVRRKRNYYQVTEFSLKDLANDTITYVTRVESIDSLGLIWLAPFGQDFSDEGLKILNSDIEKILKLATRAYYVSVVQKKIDQSEDAAIIVSKNHQKLIYHGENLVDDLKSAEELKLALETKLEETILKIKVLNQQIVDNKEAVVDAYEDLEKVKKVIDGHKESLKKIK